MKEIIIWWEKKRILYNLILISLAIFLIYDFWDYPMRTIIGGDYIILKAIGFIVFANLAYVASWGIELISTRVFYTPPMPPAVRWVFFILGTLFALFGLSFFLALVFDVMFA